MRGHKLKTWPAEFKAVSEGGKTVELRRADRDFRVGDFLQLNEFVPSEERLTGCYVFRRVTHIFTPDMPPRCLLDGFVALSIEEVGSSEENVLLGQSKLFSVEWVPA